MSTYWGYYCAQCETESYHWFNHGEDRLRDMYAVWPHVRAIREINSDIEVAYLGETAPWVFLAEHDGHSIMLCSEYDEQAPLNPQDVMRSFTMRFDVTGHERAQVQAAHHLAYLPDGSDVRRLYERALKDALHNLIQPPS